MNTTNLAATLTAHRKAAGMSMRELSRRAGISVAYVSKIEKGRTNPTVDTLEALLTALGCRITLGVDSGVEAIPQAPPLNLASRVQAGVDSASPDMLADLAEAIRGVAENHETEAGVYWGSIANEFRSRSYERRTGA